MFRWSLSCSVAIVLALAVTAPAGAHRSASGGAAAPDRPQIEELRCDTGETGRCARGATLKLDGEHLETGRAVVFLGGKGRRDDRRSTPTQATPHSLVVDVPSTARTGRVRVSSPVAGPSARSSKLRIVAPAPEASPENDLLATKGVFPVAGRYDLGAATNRFGGGRNHKGQDILARCGLPVVAAVAGKVSKVAYEVGAGNYVVVEAHEGTSQVYMHMRDAAMVKRGDVVSAGQQLGFVGTTGRSSACHLHFEQWTAPGWYRGGTAVDPLPALRGWAATG
jgi:murein DD-endopeptidase MepM/ murein hydrolase activator NlpD